MTKCSGMGTGVRRSEHSIREFTMQLYNITAYHHKRSAYKPHNKSLLKSFLETN
jgi:hypothetical protein